jgi:hypothetical protein
MPRAKPMPLDLSDDEREDFWSRVATSASIRDCWEWFSTRQSPNDGYGRIVLRGRYVLAHRVSYVIAYGVDPGRRLVLHSCDNLICVNPRHLRLGVQADNGKDEAINALMAEVHAASTGAPSRRHRKSFARWALLRSAKEKPAQVEPLRRRGRPGLLGDDQAQAIRYTFWNIARSVTVVSAAHACPIDVVRRVVARRGYRHLDPVVGEPDMASVVTGLPDQRGTAVNEEIPRWRSRGRVARASAAHVPTVAIPSADRSVNPTDGVLTGVYGAASEAA